MTKSILFLICFFMVIRLSAQQTNTNSITQKLDTFLTSANTAYKFNGTAIISKQGKILLSKGYGYRNVSSNTFNDSNSIYSAPLQSLIVLVCNEDVTRAASQSQIIL